MIIDCVSKVDSAVLPCDEVNLLQIKEKKGQCLSRIGIHRLRIKGDYGGSMVRRFESLVL